MSQKVISKEDIDYAYGVLDALRQAFDAAAVKPELGQALMVEMIKKLPEIFDALMTVTEPEHRPQVYELVKAAGRMMKGWLSYQK